MPLFLYKGADMAVLCSIPNGAPSRRLLALGYVDTVHLYSVSVKPMNTKGKEGPDSFARLVDRVLSVSKEEMLRREAEYRKQVDANPNRRGPKRKIKTSASPDPA